MRKEDDRYGFDKGARDRLEPGADDSAADFEACWMSCF